MDLSNHQANRCFIDCLMASMYFHLTTYRVHAADVLRSLHVILNRGGLLDILFPKPKKAKGKARSDSVALTDPQEALQLLALYLSAIIHDYGHRGVTNAFLIEDGDPLAVREYVSVYWPLLGG